MIRGITDRSGYYPRIAKIRLGVKSEGTTSYPRDMDYFVLTDAPEVAKVYGATPKRLIAMFPSDDIEAIFPTRMESWKSSGKKTEGVLKSKLFCSSDGETANRIYEGEKDAQGHAHVLTMPEDERPDVGEMFTLPCPMEECPYHESKDCRPVGRLNLVLPQVTWAGIYQIETSSLYAFGNLRDFVGWMRLVNKGKIAWIPFEISRKPVVASPAALKGKQVVKHVLHFMVPAQAPTIKPPPFIVAEKLMLAKEAVTMDTPEDLFPEDRPTLLPPETPAQPPARDELKDMAEIAGISEAAMKAITIRFKGDLAAIRSHLAELIERDGATKQDLFGGTETAFDR